MAKKELSLVGQARHRALARAVADSGMRQNAIAVELLGVKSPSLLNQHVNGHREIGNVWARRYESAFKLPKGSFDLGEGVAPKQPSPPLVTGDDVKAVGLRCEQSFHAITALHDLCEHSIGNPPAEGDVTNFVILRETLRGIARDMENCAEILQNDRGGLGYFAAHYGSV